MQDKSSVVSRLHLDHPIIRIPMGIIIFNPRAWIRQMNWNCCL
jgi:hypothetical protein